MCMKDSAKHWLTLPCYLQWSANCSVVLHVALFIVAVNHGIDWACWQAAYSRSSMAQFTVSLVSLSIVSDREHEDNNVGGIKWMPACMWIWKLHERNPYSSGSYYIAGSCAEVSCIPEAWQTNVCVDIHTLCDICCRISCLVLRCSAINWRSAINWKLKDCNKQQYTD